MTKVVVLMGGWSAEREVSLSTAKGVIEALKLHGYEVVPLDVTPNVAADLAAIKPDVAFNALHGRYGEDGTIQGLLELMGIPYTHSGVLASALAMDKPLAKIHFEAAGVPTAKGVVVSHEAFIGKDPMPMPYVIKPVAEGSSVGVHIVKSASDRVSAEADEWPFGDAVLVEEYVAGKEIQVAVLDGKALGAIEIRPKTGFYDYQAKYSEGLAEHLMPAPLAPDVYDAVLRYAEQAHAALGCESLTRSDFMVEERADGSARIVILEVNTQPGMTPLSLAPEIAAHAGIGYAALVDRLVKSALRRNGKASGDGEKTGKSGGSDLLSSPDIVKTA